MNDVIILKQGKWEAGVCPRLGGNLISLSYDGKNILRPLVDEKQIDEDPYLQGAPILLPANRIYLGKFSFEGVDYTLPITEPRTNSHIHGTVHRQPFTTIESDEHHVKMTYTNHGETYPFNFTMTVTYSLDENGLKQEYKIKNISGRNMPYTFCLHTTFMIPDNFTLPIRCRQEHGHLDIPTGRYVDLTEQEKKYITGSPSKDINLAGYYESCGNVVTVDDIIYTVSDNFDYWIIYNAMGKKDFTCLEPQAGKVNGLNIPDGYKVLAPNEEVTYTTSFEHK